MKISAHLLEGFHGKSSDTSPLGIWHDLRYGGLPWGDIETRVAEAAGPAHVVMANHHGYANACGPDWVRLLKPQAIVVSAWDSAHPSITPLENMLSPVLNSGPRDVFTTAIKVENIITNKRLHEICSSNGHVIVRRRNADSAYAIIVTTNRNESDCMSTAKRVYLL